MTNSLKREFVISDLHLGHRNILTFKTDDGKPLRDFPSIEEMHQTIIDNWNKTVRPEDKVYVLGDVVINKKSLPMLSSLNGKKSLIRGNHDIFKVSEYLQYFYDVQGVKVKPFKCVMTHVPVHPESLTRKSWPINIHGHLHGNKVKRHVNLVSYDLVGEFAEYLGDRTEDDPKYVSVCVEQVNYTPVDLEKIYEDKKDYLQAALS